MLIKVVPDKEYDLQHIAERFEIPVELMKSPNFPAHLDAISRVTAKKAIEIYERVNHWQFMDKMPIEVDKSDIQIATDTFEFNNGLAPASDNGDLFARTGNVAYVIKMWFKSPKLHIAVIDDEIGRKEGYLDPDEELYPEEIVSL